MPIMVAGIGIARTPAGIVSPRATRKAMSIRVARLSIDRELLPAYSYCKRCTENLLAAVEHRHGPCTV
jgi:hypothetical protein